jgi:hypothetical protein
MVLRATVSTTKKVASQHLLLVMVQEFSPGTAGTLTGWRDAVSFQDIAHG